MVRRGLPPLSALRAFEAAARHLSFSRAAAELGLTPTAISHQIRALEAQCGHVLFRRLPRPLALTPAGAKLYPVLRDGFDAIASAFSALSAAAEPKRVRVTATNAFSARRLLPKLPQWRAVHPAIRLDIVGTDDRLDLAAGEADVAIRYARETPPDGLAEELVRDTYHVVASPGLVAAVGLPLSPAELARFPLIESEWPDRYSDAPTWARWEAAARALAADVPPLSAMATLSFREELHQIAAVLAGNGIGICSDVLTASELASGQLRIVSGIALPGYGFYLVRHRSGRNGRLVDAFAQWARTSLLSSDAAPVYADGNR